MTAFICEKSLQLIVKRKRYWLVDFLFHAVFSPNDPNILNSSVLRSFMSPIWSTISSAASPSSARPAMIFASSSSSHFSKLRPLRNHLGCSISRIFFIIIFLVLYFARFIKSSCDSMSSRGPPLPPKFFHISWQTSFICTFPTLWLWSHKMDSVSRVRLLSNDACSSCETLPSSAISRTFQVQA